MKERKRVVRILTIWNALLKGVGWDEIQCTSSNWIAECECFPWLF